MQTELESVSQSHINETYSGVVCSVLSNLCFAHRFSQALEI